MNIDREVRALQQMTVGQLRTRYAEIFGEETRSGNKVYLWRRIAWRLQEREFGGLSERARARAAELADEADLRCRIPRGARLGGPPPVPPGKVVTRRMTGTDARLPAAGSVLTRLYQGRQIEVTVLATGFEYAGKPYRSLSAVAKVVTGSHWNGFAFFDVASGNRP